MRILGPIAAILLSLYSLSPAAAAVVRIGLQPTDDNAVPFYAEANGVFKRLDLTPEINDTLNGAAAIKAIEAGKEDVGFADLVSIVRQIQGGAPLVLLTAAKIYDRAEPGSELMQAARSRYRSGKDLNGKTIDSPAGPGSVGSLGPQLWIDRTGGNSRTVKEIGGIPMIKVADALNSGAVDAAEMTEPQKTIHLLKGDVKILAPVFDSIGDKYVIAGWVASKSWVAANPAAARHFAQAILETGSWANAHRAATADFLVRQMKMAPAVVKAMQRTVYAETLTAAALQPALDAAAKYGILEPVRAESLIIHP